MMEEIKKKLALSRNVKHTTGYWYSWEIVVEAGNIGGISHPKQHAQFVIVVPIIVVVIVIILIVVLLYWATMSGNLLANP